jgi:hypothetical protein
MSSSPRFMSLSLIPEPDNVPILRAAEVEEMDSED